MRLSARFPVGGLTKTEVRAYTCFAAGSKECK